MTAPSVRQIAHVCLLTHDLDASARFYEQAFGARRVFDFRRGEAWIGFYLDLGNRTFIEVFSRDAPPARAHSPIDHLCLETEDLEGLVAHLRGIGVHVTDRKLGADFTWQAWTSDPDGTKLELFQYTADSQQFTGGVCQVDW